MQRTTIRRRLISDMAILVALTGAMILAATWYAGNRTIENLSSSLIASTSDRTERELLRFFEPVRANVLSGRAWASRGILDATDHEAMTALFQPILQQHPQISSMMVANSQGAEYLLLRDPLDPHQWSNRVVQADRWGTRVLNRKWNDATGETTEEFDELDYDPRKRIWYRRALETTPDEPVYWTEPVIFFITKDPGITASTHLTNPGETPETTVVAFDLLLMDISRFTTSLEISPRGKTFVLVQNNETGDFQVVGLPNDPRYMDETAIRDALIFVDPAQAVADTHAQLPTPVALKIPSVAAAMNSWQQHGMPEKPLRFSVDGENWWGGFRPFKLGRNRFWISVVVPEEDLSAGLRLQQLLLSAVVVGVLIIGVSRAVWLAHRLSKPIESLLEQSERISTGDLEPGPDIECNVVEIRRLFESHNNMREGLKSVIKLEKLERDLDIARDIQQGLLPDEPPDAPGFQIAGWNLPADKTGGDYFDWLTLPNGTTMFTLADVTGHGIGPALIVAAYRAYMRSLAEGKDVNLTQIVSRINELLCIDISEERFITAALGAINPAKNQVELLSAGQAPMFFYDATLKELHTWSADDVPLGLMEEYEFSAARVIDFAPGDLLVITTDGFHEACNRENEQYGIEPMEQFIRQHHHMRPRDIIASLYCEIEQHVDGADQADDLTALVIKRRV